MELRSVRRQSFFWLAGAVVVRCGGVVPLHATCTDLRAHVTTKFKIRCTRSRWRIPRRPRSSPNRCPRDFSARIS